MVENIIAHGNEKRREEKKRKKKNNKPSSPGKLKDGSLKEVERKRDLLRSIAAYLQKHGFSDTLKSFLSEAQLQFEEGNVLKGQSLDLDDIFSKFVQSCKGSAKENSDHQECQGGAHINEKKEEKGSGADGVNKNELNALAVDGGKEEDKGKKRRKRSCSDSLEENLGEIVHGRLDRELEDGENHMDKSQMDSESKKKKKAKHQSIGEKFEDQKPSIEPTYHPDHLNIKDKDKKKKKNKLASGNLDEYKFQFGTEKVQIKEKNEDQRASTEVSCQSDQLTIKTKKKKHMLGLEGLNENHVQVGSAQVNESLHGETKSELHAVKNNVDLKPRECNEKEHKTNGNVEEVIFQDANKVLDKKQENSSKNPESMNGTQNQKSDIDPYTLSGKRLTAHKESAESKSVNAFKRVKINEVEYADERLQDNSYWGKGGADSGYGAKAQEVLGQVRGRNFRHEKTKKKRGSYRGGQIDLQSHSIKFNYSDDE